MTMETKADWLQRMAKKEPQPCTCGHRYEYHGIERTVIRREDGLKKKELVACYEKGCLCHAFFPAGSKR